jgi:hypothetical protein
LINNASTKTNSIRYAVLLSVLPMAFAFLGPNASAATYYVSVSGSDYNSGDAGAPFRHLSRAASVARRPGDTVIVMDGTYDNENVTNPGYVVGISASGAPGNPITFMAQNRGRAILDSGNTTTDASCNGAAAYFNLYSSSYIVIQGFVIQRGCDEGIHSNDSAHDVTIRWNEVRYIANRAIYDTDHGRDGIYINGSQYNFTFDGNSFHDIGRTNTSNFDHAIYILGSNHTVINNVFYNLRSGWAIQMADGLSNVLVANNTFVGAKQGEGGQIMMWNTQSNIRIQNNIFYNPRTYAVVRYDSSVSGCTIDNNILYGASGMIQWESGCTIGVNKIGVDPMFVNAAANDFRLQSFGPAIAAGVYGLVSLDFDGSTRSGGIDIGAYQHSGGAIAAPVVTLPGLPSIPVVVPPIVAPIVVPPVLAPIVSAGATIPVSPMSFTILAGGSTASQNAYIVVNGGPADTPNRPTATTASGLPWLVATPSPVNGVVTVGINGSLLSPGTYTGTVTVVTNQGTANIPVTLTVR